MRQKWQDPQKAGVAVEHAAGGAEQEPALTRLGTLQCDAIACASKGGITCAHVDRRSRPCPTAWCPNHRVVVDNIVFCSVHGATVGGTQSDFGDSGHPEADNPLPAAVVAVAHMIEDDMIATLQAICDTRDEMLISDPVRRVFVGIQRDRTWERSWKVCSATGISVKVSVVIADEEPDELLIKVNSTVVATIPVPPASMELLDPRGMDEVIRETVTPVAEALMVWERDNPKDTFLVGRPLGRPAVPVPPFSFVLSDTPAETPAEG